MQTAKRVAEAARYLRKLGVEPPLQGVVLEERMRGFAAELQGLSVVQQRRVAGFPQPRRGDAGGRLLFGRLNGTPTGVVEGRLHLYEGALPGECSLGVRLLAAAGARSVALVAEGIPLREGLDPGTVLVLADRLDLTGVANLKGVLDATGGPLIEVPATAPDVVACARSAGARAGLRVEEGVASLVHGPLLPGPAERRMHRSLGADACTAALGPELAAAAYLRLRSAAFLILGPAWEKAHLDFLQAFLEEFRAGDRDGAGVAGGPAGGSLDASAAPA